MKEKVKLTFARLVLSLILLIAGMSFGQSSAGASAPAGTIAYVVPNQPDGDEIHLIEPDGLNDRVIYSTGEPINKYLQEIGILTWKPDASELTFSSSEEDGCSVFAQDIYAIRADGKYYRRVSGPPACASRAGLPTGTVIVPVENHTGEYGPFTFYIEGATGPVELALAPGASTNITFTNVADYGSQNQMAVWAYGEARAYYPNAWADVQPGKTVRTGVLEMNGGFEHWGFSWPNYLPDGSKIASVFNASDLYLVNSTNTKMGDIGDKQAFNMTMSAYYLAWAPVPELADLFLFRGWVTDSNYTSKSPIMLGDVHDSGAITLLDVDPKEIGSTVLGITWLPDGSGFLFSLTQLNSDYRFGANIWEYSFASGDVWQVTNIPYGFTRQIAVSPDGQTLLFELQPSGDWYDVNPPIDLWMANRDGSGATMFVENGRSPAWSRQQIPDPLPEPAPDPVPDPRSINLFLPFVRK